MKYPGPFLRLIESFKTFPGVGEKTALRMALFVVENMEDESVQLFSDSLAKVKTDIHFCDKCHMMMETTCPICEGPHRDHTTLMVVESVREAIIIENSGSYQGLYHILGGKIDFSKGVEPGDLNIDSLFKRLDSIKEIILSLSGGVEGELTGSYISELLNDKDIKLTRIAVGIPVGSDLSYADKRTLTKALNNRVVYKKE